MVWDSLGQDGGSYGVFGQRFSSTGLPVGSEFQINSYTTSVQSSPAVASDANGNFLVVWHSDIQDGSSQGIFGQRFSLAGIPMGSEFQINSFTTGNQSQPSVASDTDGNFVIVWHSVGQDGSGYGVFGQRFSPAGIPMGSEFRANAYTASDQLIPAVASAANGTFVVVWNSYGEDGSNFGVFGQRYDVDRLTVSNAGTGTGTVTSSPPGINCGTDCGETFNHGTSVTLTAAADPTSTFSGWSGGGCLGTGTCIVAMNSSVQVTATFAVIQATPVMTWANPASIVYGTALGASQLNATANVAGTFVYTPAAGTVLNAGAGQTLSVLFTPADLTLYTTASKSVSIDVTKATPVIAWATPAPIVAGTPLSGTQLNATASHGGAAVAGAFVYTPPAGTVLTMGDRLLSTAFTPANGTNFTGASASVSISVNAAPSIVSDPAHLTRVRGYGASFSAGASGWPSPSVQWQVSLNGGVTWSERAGATGTTYAFTAALADSGNQYRAVFTNSLGSANSRAATLTVRDGGVAGDLDGDGQPEMLWRSQVNGTNAVWDLTGVAHVSTGWLPAEPDTSWALVGIGDVNGDGRADLFWRNLTTLASAVWYLDGLTRIGTDALDAELDPSWLVVGTGDLNGDRKPDLVWRHRTSGAMRVWYLDGPVRIGTGTMDTIADPAWAVAGIGDVNGDGAPDLVLRNGVTGANEAIYLTGATTIGSAALDPEPDLNWTLVGTGDFSGDGHVDLLWRHALTGAMRAWYLTGTVRSESPVVDGGVAFAWTPAGNGSSAPGVPAGLTASASGSSITLSWTAPASGGRPTAYVIDAGSAPGFSNLASFSTGSTGTSFTANGVASGRYLLRVRAVNGAGSSAPSNEATLVVGTPPPLPPGPPIGLSAIVSGSSLTLSWSAPASGGAVTAYQVEAGSWPGGSDLASLSTGNTATSFFAPGVANGTYYLRVRAAGAAGLGAPSNEVTAQVGPAPPAAPGPPSGLTASASGSSIALSWTAPSTGGAVTAYRVEAGAGPGLANLANFSTGSTATTFNASGVADGMYHLRVRATNSIGTSAPSNEAILAVGCSGPPGAPTSFRVTSNSGGTVTFAWNAPGGSPTGYVLEAGATPGATNLAVLNLGGAATTFTASGVGSGTYYVRVRAKNACGTSSVSNEVVLIVP